MKQHAYWIAACLAVAVVVPSKLQAADRISQTIDDVLPRMVKIFGAGGIRRLHSYSTGFLVSPQGHIATVWSHVLDTGDDFVNVVLDDGRRLRARVLGAEPQLDLAVLKIDEELDDLPYFDLEKEIATADPGTRVLAFSNMFRVATGDEPVSVLHGVVAARTRLSARRGAFSTPYDGPVYVVDAITNNPGAGGGVLVTRDGRLLGMIGKELRNAESNTWINYAIPATELKSTIEQIISGRYIAQPDRPQDEDSPERYRPVDFGLVLVPDVIYRTPAYVDRVIRDSAAEKAGLRPDDLIVFVNDELVQSCRELRRALGRLEAGETLQLTVRRGDRLISFDLPVERKADEGGTP